MRNDIAELVPRVDDAHRGRLPSWQNNE
jgi:hypothetical protein